MINNQAYTEAFRTGMHAACNHVTLDQITAIAHALPVMEGNGMLAGYHAELHKLRAAAETAKMEIYTVTAGNRFFWQKLAVMAPNAETAAQSFRAYLAEPAQMKSEEDELKDAKQISYEEDYDGEEVRDRDSYRYRFDDDAVEESDETELRRRFSGRLDTVRMVDSGGNG